MSKITRRGFMKILGAIGLAVSAPVVAETARKETLHKSIFLNLGASHFGRAVQRHCKFYVHNLKVEYSKWLDRDGEPWGFEIYYTDRFGKEWMTDTTLCANDDELMKMFNDDNLARVYGKTLEDWILQEMIEAGVEKMKENERQFDPHSRMTATEVRENQKRVDDIFLGAFDELP